MHNIRSGLPFTVLQRRTEENTKKNWKKKTSQAVKIFDLGRRSARVRSKSSMKPSCGHRHPCSASYNHMFHAKTALSQKGNKDSR